MYDMKSWFEPAGSAMCYVSAAMCYNQAMPDGEPSEAIDLLGTWGPYNSAHYAYFPGFILAS